MSEEKVIYERDESFRDSIATVDESGKRNWIFPKKQSGKYFKWRTYLSWVYLAVFFAAPWIKIGGEPLLMLNVIERKFVIFGQIFWPQDFHLFALLFITSIVFIILFTVVYGRIFCGWVCPQTIFMEMVFRKIEYFIEGDAPKQKKLDQQDWNWEKIKKRGLKYIVFYAVSVAIAHTFLAYLIGSDELLRMQIEEPMANIGTLGLLLIFSAVFYFVFAYMREQVCIAVCPYGRLQGVLLDRNSVVVAYDYVRGEKRGPFKGKRENRQEVGKGDCIDCHKCVDVCPTGIDIRNGTQLECINCTLCIDACDSIMDKVGFEQGLIRYASEEQIANKTEFKFTGRMKAYSVLLFLLMSFVVTLFFLRTDVEVSIFRTKGPLYQIVDESHISNLYNVKLVNKTNNDLDLTLKLLNAEGEIKFIGQEASTISIESQQKIEGVMFLTVPNDQLTGMATELEVGVYNGEEEIDIVTTNFLGPTNMKR